MNEPPTGLPTADDMASLTGSAAVREVLGHMAVAASSASLDAGAEMERTLGAHHEAWRELSDLAANAQASLIQTIAGTDSLLRESIQRQVEGKRWTLQSVGIGDLERLLIERFIACWLLVEFLSLRFPAVDANQRRGRFIQQRRGKARRMLEAARRSLQLVRKLRSDDVLREAAATRWRPVPANVPRSVSSEVSSK